MGRSIFDLADKFNYNSPWEDDWLQNAKQERGEREAKRVEERSRKSVWPNVYFAISVPPNTPPNPSMRDAANLVYSYHTSIGEVEPTFQKDFKALKDSFDYISTSTNSIAKAYLSWMKSSREKFLFRIGLHDGRSRAKRSL